jgi:hypothetical protein
MAEQRLEKGRAGAGAELEVTCPTSEDDGVVTYDRVVPGEPGLEAFTDATHDTYGDGSWTRAACPHATGVTDLGECEETTLG